MNVVLDIDETFVQFVGKDDWEQGVPDKDKPKYKTTDRDEDGFFILRPYFNEFFDFLFKNCKTVNLWTLSDEKYALKVAEMIGKFGKQQDKDWTISYVWHEQDSETSSNEYGGVKNLKWIRWDIDGSYMPFNTILIDDLPGNTQHEHNIKNGIQIRPFNPLGEKLKKEERTRTSIRDRHYTDLTKDDTLKKVIAKLQEVFDKPPFEGSTKVNVGGGRRKSKRVGKSKRVKRVVRKTSRR